VSLIHIDGKTYEVDGEQNLLHVCLGLGFDLPYFCWHPALGSVGACRQCAVKQFKDADDEQGKIVMACMTLASDGTRISIADEAATAFRSQVVEWLMLNHPHDCPICDEGGECHLQDMTVMTGHAYRRTRFRKRTFRNQDLGPVINHEMNRCIECYRCVRFYRDYAGGDDLEVLGAHDHVYFGRQEEGTLESPFSGNLVEVCPTGVFTDKTLKRHYTRKWDLQAAPSICTHCAMGCNITAGERYGTLRRILNRYNGDVNGYFLCDRGRFGYEFVNDEDRIREPRVRSTDGVPAPAGVSGADDSAGPASGTSAPAPAESPRAPADGAFRAAEPDEAVRAAAVFLKACDRVIGIGSPRASLEANFALRSMVGAEDYFTGLSGREARLTDKAISILRDGSAPSASLRQAEEADAVLLLGEDPEKTAPRLALALRQAARNQPMRGLGDKGVQQWHDHAVRNATHGQSGPLYVATPDRTSLDPIATGTHRAAPDDVARLGFAVAHALDPSAPAVGGLGERAESMAREIAGALAGADRPLVVAGPAAGSEAVFEAAANVAWALRKAGRDARIVLTSREVNTLGVGLLGGGTLEEAVAVVRDGGRVGMIVLEHDLARSLPGREADQLLDGADALIVLDHLYTGTTRRADVVLPAGTFAESQGTVVSSEGRAQRFFRVFPPDGSVRESWRWLSELARRTGREDAAPWKRFDELVARMAAAVPALAGAREAAPDADTRLPGGKVPRQPTRYSGRTSMHADRNVSEQQRPDDPESALAYSMEGTREKPPSALLPMFHAPGWNSMQAVNKFQEEIAGPLKGGDPGVRLIEADGRADAPYFQDVPAPFEPETGRWLVLPAPHVFGTEELSARAPGVAQRAPAPYVGLASADVERLGLEPGAPAVLSLDGEELRLSVSIHPDLPEGVAVVPAGLSGLPALALPSVGTVKGGA